MQYFDLPIISDRNLEKLNNKYYYFVNIRTTHDKYTLYKNMMYYTNKIL